jgi:hypothetical protein
MMLSLPQALALLVVIQSTVIFANAQAITRSSATQITAPSGYVADFVSTAASGVAMNNAASVTGTSYQDPGCGWQCLPPVDPVVWRNGVRIVLPSLPAFSGITVRGINSAGWVAGYAGQPETGAHAVVWKPNGTTYVAIDLGLLPGTDVSTAAGIDDQGRVVGYSLTKYFPPTGAPFLWTESGGMVDLSAQGFPNEAPLAISPGGTVALSNRWYRLGDPNSVVTMAEQPRGFYPPGNGAVAINDAGDQARFLAATTSQALGYLFRYHHEGVWQQIGFTGNGHLLPYGIGSINAAQDVTATDHGQGIVAYGPDGLEQGLTSFLPPSYQGAEVTVGGTMNSAGQILSRVMIGRSQRLMRLLPAPSCLSNCMKVNTLQMTGEFIDDPKDPGHCTPDAKDHVVVNLQVTTKANEPLRAVLVRGHFLDDYWMDKPVTGVTDANGMASFVHDGLACVGAVAFLVDSATQITATVSPSLKGMMSLDKTTGILTDYVIPLPK